MEICMRSCMRGCIIRYFPQVDAGAKSGGWGALKRRVRAPKPPGRIKLPKSALLRGALQRDATCPACGGLIPAKLSCGR
jgi:hypothetical protein